MTAPEPTWLRNQKLAIDIVEAVQPRIARATVERDCDGLLRAVARESVFVGYRPSVKPTRKMFKRTNLFNQMSSLVSPRISVYMRKHHQDTLDLILHEILGLGYRLVPVSKTKGVS